jgi:ribonuclease-3
MAVNDPAQQDPAHDSSTTDGPVSARTELAWAIGLPVEAPLLERALTHRSYAYEHGGLPTNERLELLGDSVLGFVVAETLYHSHPDLPEGGLSTMRNAVVNQQALAEVARALGVGACVLLGRGEETSGGRDKPSILGDTLEALIGAVYLDRGLEAASELVRQLFGGHIEQSADPAAGQNWKALLLSLASAMGLGAPEYDVTESGPDHDKTFRASVKVGTKTYGPGEAKSTKKAAEANIAEVVYQVLHHQAAHPAVDGEAGQGPGGSQ